MKRILVHVLIILILNIFMYGNEKTQIDIDPVSELYRSLKKENNKSNFTILIQKNDVKEYVNFLLKNNKLSIENNHQYEIIVFNVQEDWLVLLGLLPDKKNEYITDALDSVYKYAFIINKQSGAVSHLTKLL